MDCMTAIGVAEGFIESNGPEHELEAWQYLIDKGICWQLQGWFGRTAMHLIETGACTPPRDERIEAVAPKAIRTKER